MADTLAEMWEAAKTTFEDTTGKKKPKESKGIFNAFGNYTGLSGSLGKFDEANDAAEKTNNQKSSDLKAGRKLATAMETHLANFAKAKTAYVTVLKKAIADQFGEREDKDKEVKTTYERALKFLVKSLDAVEETGESRLGAIRQRFDEAEKDLTTKEKMLLNWEKNIKATIARAAAAAGKVKMSPTVETYNSIFPKAARDVTMQLVFTKSLSGFMGDPEDALREMNPWASQSGNPPASLPEDTSKEDVIKNLAGFIKSLKTVQQLVNTRNYYR